MKRIVILCDGTWNRSDSLHPTNVIRFAQAMLGEAPDGTAQVPVYIAGVGTGRGIARRLDSLIGGAFGKGLFANLVEAYQHLVFMYEPGDEIHILGFSRGAYTARSLAGLLRSTGIVERRFLHRVPEALSRYRTLNDPATHPSSEDSHRFRLELSPRIATSTKEIAWRRENGHGDAKLLTVSYLGVWDTVGALGVPVGLPLIRNLAARRYRFHDASLSSMVKSARHAVALDETRPAFQPTLWDNVDELNRESAPSGSPEPYQQKWFAGDHGSVGGGGDVHALSSIGLAWIIEGAQDAGLVFDDAELQAIRNEQEVMGPLRNTTTPASLLSRVMRLRAKDRVGPATPRELHPSVIRRWQAEAESRGFQPYRPGSLRRIAAALDAERHGGLSTATAAASPEPHAPA
ncbi:DUF2235 domain-containing protein [Paracoccus sp. S-4012]|uniref:DUF2235 domain-containing protein n=1 Tax=Paracoccus sp. S-4012 TaxID=2665648 RepID=UPI0018A22650|nr:DUF2235 domain-containing protein [Paracoccus sp. S-4012]